MWAAGIQKERPRLERKISELTNDEHALGQVDGPALPYPGEIGQLRAGPSTVCGLTVLSDSLREVAPRCVVLIQSLGVRLAPKTLSSF